MTRTMNPVSQQDKITALWKHAAERLQHHGQLLAAAVSRSSREGRQTPDQPVQHSADRYRHNSRLERQFSILK